MLSAAEALSGSDGVAKVLGLRYAEADVLKFRDIDPLLNI